MDTGELRHFVHEIANALNAAKINAYLLGKLNGDAIDKETFAGLNSAIKDGEVLVADFHRKIHAEMVRKEREPLSATAGTTTGHQ